jgi:hypothetical protein
VSPLLVDYNTKLEKQLDAEITKKQWSLKIPILNTYVDAKYSKQSKLA